MALCKHIKNLPKLFKHLKLGDASPITQLSLPFRQCAATVHTTRPRNDLMEFFDDKKNWGELEVKVGRSWRLEELRIKSNSDLHKLWYILLKERNMLMTMEHHCKEEWKSFPNPERLDKVEESMENLERVVRERNRAYWELEVGETGERPTEDKISFTGLRYKHSLTQHRIPKVMNKKWKELNDMWTKFDDKPYQQEFLSKTREHLWNTKRRKNRRDFQHVCNLLKRFPDLDQEAVKRDYPNVDLQEALKSKRTRGNREGNLV